MTTRLLIIFSVLLLCCLSSHAFGDRQQSDDNLLKAVFIYNFAKFTRWPDDTRTKNGSPLRICSVGDDELSQALLKLDGRTLRERPVTVDRIHDGSGLDTCHVLYLARSLMHEVNNIADSVRFKPVLTISEITDFSKLGGMIELYSFDGRIRFKINLKAVRGSGLYLSSRLLKLADIVPRQQ